MEREAFDSAATFVDQYTVDDYFVDRAIDLAWLGVGRTHPNPLVGALVVKDGRILGVGYHQRYGEEHAETIALDRAGEAAKGATLYVTLEPCTHQGNTPPCVDHVLQSGVSRVVISTLDPDHRVNGRGVQILRKHGVEVDLGRRAERALLLNMGCFKRVMGLGMTVTLKMAATLDGRIASRAGSRDDITGEEARRFVHRLRAAHDGILVGINTVLVDSPRLDCRLLDSVEPPPAVVLDTHLKFPLASSWLDGNRTVVLITGPDAGHQKAKDLEEAGAHVVRCRTEGDRVELGDAIRSLLDRGMNSLLVEGGGELFSSFVDAGEWDGLFMFFSPALFGPDGVGLSDRRVDRARVGAVHAGISMISGDMMMSFVNGKTRRLLLDRLL
ncbi:MAG: bifunctional diaminohydroxyphosphoribosylaminopyrimidine deaminase/5-amino-6-(5-phosphoribosylamino)uracil reductase RibD [Candidatus Latescibacterota bacterium]|nr:MAG: bifunctional diaminohydroxyphosphoribosylaminopyrimidine deaminase/5-amino-6-(5-phosphoribosylamino)uracil reductase RibD [Candidatus Latescibacterota bacterium]